MAEALSPEAEQELAALRDALAGELDEQVVAAQWFRPPGWGSPLKGVGRFFKRLGGKEPQDRLRATNVMALTPSRVVAYTLGTASGSMRAGKALAEWPRTEVSVGSEGHTVQTTKQVPDMMPDHTQTDMTLVTLRGRGGRPLLLEGDFPRGELTRHLVES